MDDDTEDLGDEYSSRPTTLSDLEEEEALP